MQSARDEHKEAVEWLNRHTDEEVGFFLIGIELWKIDDSKPAPRFQIIAAPNEWTKNAKLAVESSRSLTETKQLQLDFWNGFREFAQEAGTSLKLRKVRPQHWYNISAGSSKWHIALTINTTTGQMGCQAYIPRAPEIYEKFEANKDAIENAVGSHLEWMPLEDRQACRVKLSDGCDLEDLDRWPEYFAWMIDMAERFHKVFNKYD